METYRFLGHGMSDVDRPYRTREEEREWRESRDPIDQLRRILAEDWQVSKDELDSISSNVALQIDISVEAAQKAPLPDAEELTKHIYAD